MRVFMPLFNFQYFDREDFYFSDKRLSIRHFDDWGDLPNRAIFSDRDREHMANEQKALVAESDNLERFQQDTSLLLMSFRLLSEGTNITPIIKYRLSDDDNFCSRIGETETHIRLDDYRFEVYNEDYARGIFVKIDKLYMQLRQAEVTSYRLKNALFFFIVLLIAIIGVMRSCSTWELWKHCFPWMGKD